MTKKQARVFLLILILLIPICRFSGSLLDKKLPKRIAAITYPEKGITFSLDKHDRVRGIAIRRYRKDLTDSSIPGENEILPGIGAFGIRLGDSADRVIEKLGRPNYWEKRKRRQVMTYRRGGTVGFIFASGSPTITAIVIGTAEAATPEGITVGSSKEEVLSRYGEHGKVSRTLPSSEGRALGQVSSRIIHGLLLGFWLWAAFSKRGRIRKWKFMLLIIVWTLPATIIIVNVSYFLIMLLRSPGYSSFRHLYSMDFQVVIAAASLFTAAGVGIIAGRILAQTCWPARNWVRHLSSPVTSIIFQVIASLVIQMALHRRLLGLTYTGHAHILGFSIVLYLSFVIFENMFKTPSAKERFSEA